MIRMKRLIFLFTFILIFHIISGCSDTLLDRLSDPRDDGSLEVWSGSWVIYDDGLNTNGDLMLGPLDDNQVIEEVEDAYKGAKALKYKWSGEPVKEEDFCYLSFIAATSFETYDDTPGRNLTLGGYTSIRFYAKGRLSENTKVEFKGPKKAKETADTNTIKITPGQNGVPALLENKWQMYEIDISDSDLTEVKDYFIIAFVREGDSEGGKVFVDEIEYR